ncbi:6,7-dimethyl-8-ribityllumazine synthase [Sorangium cellulosum]|uniref:6,7-dimethyl-8-ribityllumazine synthase n=1 Tax=Sorangium cellulosum TaxID=56 RepID=A0A4P2Q8L5_SORCE|nr:6,7-dimethyl-8-ribityllumazine synthase [Sorangium cellulosum]AUX25927.1 6,7-dimethyl-8-ribityllumazine synthase [Sorangium cellulosum]
MAQQAVGQAQPRIIEGNLVVPPGARFALVASRFNHFIVDRLVEGALDAIARHGGALERTSIVRVPGAWEVPTVVGRLAHKKSVDAIIALGTVIRGSTPHFDYVAAEVTKGIAAVSLQTGLPVTFGILTTDSIEQAIERAGTKHGNKGWEAAVSAIEMLALGASLDAAGL